ncbi:MAG: UMP kinase [Spirochaetales bacterium]|nr:UMP kinase [Spirochaetales bacterium]
MQNIKVISLGGSIIVPDKVDRVFLKDFYRLIITYLEEEPGRKIILVCGGGGPAREYQGAYREIIEKSIPSEEDWIGIAATKLNAALLKHMFAGYCVNEVIENPTIVPEFTGRILVASGWKPGFSTDYDAVILAEQFSADAVINLSNIEKVYTADPKIDPAATPIDRITWVDFRNIVGDTWVPGKNLPFDPIASKKAAELHLRVIIASGKDCGNIKKILYGEPFHGTIIE